MAAKVKKPIPNFTLGCDPELFLMDLNGQLKASCGLIGGTKEAPQQIDALGEGYAVQEDNVAVEFNIPPAGSAREFINSITRTMKVLQDGINIAHGLTFSTLSAAEFPKEELEHPAAKVFGCDPDYNAWTGKKNPKPKADDPTLRSCGGHIHIGYPLYVCDPKRLVKCIDLVLGVPATIMDAAGAKRRKLYGKRGAFRPKPYGVEYRTLSNFWVLHPELEGWVWRGVENAFDKALNGFPIDDYDKDIEFAIDAGDHNAAYTMCSELGLEVVHV